MSEHKTRERLAAILDATTKVTAKEDQEGNTLVNTYQDVEPHMEYAAKLRRADAEERGAFGKRPDMHKVMSVPTNVIYAVAAKLQIPYGQIFDKEHSLRVWAELKRPEFQAFRTSTDKHL